MSASMNFLAKNPNGVVLSLGTPASTGVSYNDNNNDRVMSAIREHLGVETREEIHGNSIPIVKEIQNTSPVRNLKSTYLYMINLASRLAGCKSTKKDVEKKVILGELPQLTVQESFIQHKAVVERSYRDIVRQSEFTDLKAQRRYDYFEKRKKGKNKKVVDLKKVSKLLEFKKLKDEEKVHKKDNFKPESCYNTALAMFDGIPDFKVNVLRLLNLFALLAECESNKSIFHAITGYLLTFLSDDKLDKMMQLVKTMLYPEGTDTMVPEAKLFDKHEHKVPPWLELLKKGRKDWRTVVHCEGFSRLSNLISLLVTVGLCDASTFTIDVAGIRLFAPKMLSKHENAFSLLDAIMDTVIWFVEAGHMCFKMGSLNPLKYADQEMMKFDEDFATAEAALTAVQAGNLEKFYQCDENDYQEALDDLRTRMDDFLVATQGTPEYKIVREKSHKLILMQAKYNQLRSCGGIRVQPYAIEIFGGSGVGKSTIGQVLMELVLRNNGYDYQPHRIVTLSECDQYDSNMKSHINGIYADDVAQMQAKYISRNPLERLLYYINNVRHKATMAEAELKGKVEVEPKCIVATTNVKDLNATIYCNEPIAIARRFKTILTVRVKEQYATHAMLDQSKVADFLTDPETGVYTFNKYANLWDIDIEHAIENEETKGINFIPFTFEGQITMGVDLPFLCRFLNYHTREHFASQKRLVTAVNNPIEPVYCSSCNCEKTLCECSDDEDCEDEASSDSNRTYHYGSDDEEDSEEEKVEKTVPEKVKVDDVKPEAAFTHYVFAKTILTPLVKRVNNYLGNFWKKTEEVNMNLLASLFKTLETSPFLQWTNWIPESWFDKPMVQQFISYHYKKEIYRKCYQWGTFYAVVVAHMSWNAFKARSRWHLLPAFVTLLFGTLHLCGMKKEILSQLVNNNRTMSEVFKSHRDNYMRYILGGSFILGIAYTAIKAYREYSALPQGSLEPASMKEIEERDNQTNDWATVEYTSLPQSNRSRTASTQELKNIVINNLCHATIITKDWKAAEVDALFLKSNVCLIPVHCLPDDDVKVRFLRKNKSVIGAQFECYVSRKSAIEIPGTDLMLVYVPNGGSWKDITEYFLTSCGVGSTPIIHIHKNSEGALIEQVAVQTFSSCITNGTGKNFYGGSYTLEQDSFVGNCGSVIISDTKFPSILGVHLGGHKFNRKYCVHGGLTQKQIHSAFEQLNALDSTTLCHSNGVLPESLYGIDFYQGQECSEKSPVRFMEEGTNFVYYGSCTGAAKYTSTVEKSIISTSVTKVMGSENKWGAPKFKGPDGRSRWHPWRESLKYSTKPSIGIPVSLLEKATDDYAKLIGLIDKRNPEILSQVRPLTEMETLCGIDGVKFIDKMKPNTSIGYPLGGPKSRYITNLEPTEDSTHQYPAVLDKQFTEYRDTIKDAYRRGERGHLIFKACLKDEPTLKTKDKVRVFQGASIALQLLARQYFLPIARVISLYPLYSECAVGVNARGPEWEQLHQHITYFGDDRILAGDYSKYDLRMPAQLILASFSILEKIAKRCNYSDDDLIIMRGVATDIAYPVMAYNGDLLQLIGSNPSGQNLTVYINSIGNSLLLRCGFYHIYPKAGDFRSIARMMTYGDDVKGSVHKSWSEFNHISFAEFLSKHDMKFTMPDKESVPTKYMKDEDADFLKRKSIFVSELGCHIGILDENSIFKSLHCNLESKTTSKREVSASCIQSALCEWFPYGSEVYEQRRAQLKQIAQQHGITHMVPDIDSTYELQVQKWKEKYMPNSSEESKLIVKPPEIVASS